MADALAPTPVLEGVVPGISFRVESGDAAPPLGVPFDPEANFDVEIGPALRVIKRGEKTAVIFTEAGSLQAYVDKYKKAAEKAGPVLAEVEEMAQAQAEMAEREKEAEEEAAKEAAKPGDRPQVEPFRRD